MRQVDMLVNALVSLRFASLRFFIFYLRYKTKHFLLTSLLAFALLLTSNVCLTTPKSTLTTLKCRVITPLVQQFPHCGMIGVFTPEAEFIFMYPRRKFESFTERPEEGVSITRRDELFIASQ